MQLWVLNVSRPQVCDFPGVTPEIDIWRAATLMLKRSSRPILPTTYSLPVCAGAPKVKNFDDTTGLHEIKGLELS